MVLKVGPLRQFENLATDPTCRVRMRTASATQYACAAPGARAPPPAGIRITVRIVLRIKIGASSLVGYLLSVPSETPVSSSVVRADRPSECAYRRRK